MSHEHHATSADALWAGEMIGLELGGVPIVLLNVDGNILAYRDRCPHQGVRLSRGRLEGTTLTCSAHQWTYDVQSGYGINPCHSTLEPVPVHVHGGQVWVRLTEANDGD
jgi:toluene monooxygenase system ferredoxin subunit